MQHERLDLLRLGLVAAVTLELLKRLAEDRLLQRRLDLRSTAQHDVDGLEARRAGKAQLEAVGEDLEGVVQLAVVAVVLDHVADIRFELLELRQLAEVLEAQVQAVRSARGDGDVWVLAGDDLLGLDAVAGRVGDDLDDVLGPDALDDKQQLLGDVHPVFAVSSAVDGVMEDGSLGADQHEVHDGLVVGVGPGITGQGAPGHPVLVIAGLHGGSAATLALVQQVCAQRLRSRRDIRLACVADGLDEVAEVLRACDVERQSAAEDELGARCVRSFLLVATKDTGDAELAVVLARALAAFLLLFGNVFVVLLLQDLGEPLV